MDEYISREELIKALEIDYNGEWCSKPLGGPEYIEGAEDEYNDVLSVVRGMKAADVQPISQWISVKDRQPQENGFYLTYYSKQIHVSQWFISANWYNEHGGNVTNNVEYWQPLPEPPKDGDTE